MAEMTATTWVLRGVCVRQDVKAGWVRLGTQYPQGHRRMPSIPFSMRHPSRGCPFKGIEPRMRPNHVNDLDADPFPGAVCQLLLVADLDPSPRQLREDEPFGHRDRLVPVDLLFMFARHLLEHHLVDEPRQVGELLLGRRRFLGIAGE